jgi:hypothetical protein
LHLTNISISLYPLTSKLQIKVAEWIQVVQDKNKCGVIFKNKQEFSSSLKEKIS